MKKIRKKKPSAKETATEYRRLRALRRQSRRAYLVKRRQAAAKLYPWRVSVEYIGFHTGYDELLRKIGKGAMSEGSGFMFMSSRRDMAWMCKTEEQARKLGLEFVELPGIVNVTISGNLTEERAIEIAMQPRKPHAKRRKRRKVKP